jgi:hypothetical protein
LRALGGTRERALDRGTYRLDGLDGATRGLVLLAALLVLLGVFLRHSSAILA